MGHILVVYYVHTYPLRATISDHLLSFRRYAGRSCIYLNLAACKVPSLLFQIPIDLVIFHTSYLSRRWGNFQSVVERARPLKDLKAKKIALPQDEFIHTDMLCEFIREFGIDNVFSVAPPSEWKKIYEGIDCRKVKFSQVLTGYLDEGLVKQVERITSSMQERPIDIGYRAWRAAYWLGKHGLLKGKIADVFQEIAPKFGLSIDISTRDKDTLLGSKWYKHLLRIKYVIGIEGGASILDRDGSIRHKTDQYLALHPKATFDEVAAACFPGLEGSLNLFAISPRHLEACLTRTCQVLVEGEYNGILKPGKHYIELKRDFSNLEQVMEAIQRDDQRQPLVEAAYRDVVVSRRYTYERFVKFVLEQSLPAPLLEPFQSGFKSRWMGWGLRKLDGLVWVRIMLEVRLVRPFKEAIYRWIPGSLRAKFEKHSKAGESKP